MSMSFSNYYKEWTTLVHGVKVKEWTIKGQSTRAVEVKGDAVITVHNGTR